MALKRFSASNFQRSDGTMIRTPPDAVFTPVNPLAIDINIEDTPSTQQWSIGTRLEDIWGRVFRYCEVGGTIAQNSLSQAEVPDAVHDALNLTTAVTAGDTSVEVNSPESGTADFIVNEYAQGWLYSETLEPGIAYPISDHLAWDISTTTDLTVNLFHAIQTAMVAACALEFVKSKFKEIIVHPAPQTAAVNGVMQGSGAVDGDFAWIQTRGPCKILTDAGTATVIGYAVRPSEDDDGAIALQDYDEADDANQGTIGRMMNIGGDGNWSLVDLALE
jgi:hypothetical protein